jgi:hypothetical protein
MKAAQEDLPNEYFDVVEEKGEEQEMEAPESGFELLMVSLSSCLPNCYNTQMLRQ